MNTAPSTAAVAVRSAIDEWRRLLKDEHVLVGEDFLRHYSRTCIPYSNTPLAVLRPGSLDEVRHAVRIAATQGVPLYPISRGKNWGYGSASPSTEGQVILDLSRLDRIIEVNAELAYAVIEPGVTQGQLDKHLRDHGNKLMLDVTGAGPDASIVGNALERGFGHTPYGDRFGNTCGLEVLLADGRILNTGFGAYEDAQAHRVYPYGIGPWIDGLFTQSNFGIVTKLGLWLMPRPPVCQAFGFTVREHARLGEIADRLRELHLLGVLTSKIHIANDLRVLSARMSYPWHLTNGETPLPDQVRETLRQEAALGAWNVLGGLYGTKKSVAAARKEIRRAFRGLARVRFFDDAKIRRLGKLAQTLRPIGLGHKLRETLTSASSVFDLINGVPSSEHLKGIGWRSRSAGSSTEPTDFGGMWLSPVVPMTSDAARNIVDIVETVITEYDFEPLITLTTINSRALCCVATVSFDKDLDSERKRAAECYDELFDRCVRSGCIPYRVGIQSMRKLRAAPSTYWDVCGNLKSALDPEGTFAPGRYEPRARG